jgi:hypothetical protein
MAPRTHRTPSAEWGGPPIFPPLDVKGSGRSALTVDGSVIPQQYAVERSPHGWEAPPRTGCCTAWVPLGPASDSRS